MKKILIIGGGTGGIMTAAQLLKKKNVSVTLLDPAEFHYYQAAWTLVGADTYDFDKTRRSMASVMPSGVNWIKEYAETIDPENNQVTTKSGKKIDYDYLVASPGIKIDTSLIEGLTESLGKGVVCSNYTDPNHTREVIKNFKGGNAVFTQPATPIKCGGAPQKTAYLAADYFKKNNLLDKTNVVFATPGSVIFGVKEIKETLEKVIARYGIHFRPHYAPIKVDGENRVITFKYNDSSENECVINKVKGLDETVSGDQIIEMSFDMLHLAPPQTAPDFIKNSPLANDAGWVDVDHGTLQHKKFNNVFGMGDAAALPTAKTGAAIRKQVPIVVENITRLINGKGLSENVYNGYSSCPLVTGYGKMVLAEFDYDSNFIPDPKLKGMLIADSSKEHLRLWWLKKYILPYLYWNKMLKGIEV